MTTPSDKPTPKRASIFEDEADTADLDLSKYAPKAMRSDREAAKRAAEQAAAESGFDRYTSPRPASPPTKETRHLYTLRVPVSQFEQLRIWAERVSPRDSIHTLVLKAITEKLERLENGQDRD